MKQSKSNAQQSPIPYPQHSEIFIPTIQGDLNLLSLQQNKKDNKKNNAQSVRDEERVSNQEQSWNTSLVHEGQKLTADTYQHITTADSSQTNANT